MPIFLLNFIQIVQTNLGKKTCIKKLTMVNTEKSWSNQSVLMTFLRLFKISFYCISLLFKFIKIKNYYTKLRKNNSLKVKMFRGAVLTSEKTIVVNGRH
jgi:hypothetical protein